jgi:hypothetical protein
MIPELNDWYKYLVQLKPWQEVAFELIEENYSDYCDLIEYWLRKLDVQGFEWKKFTTRRNTR